MASAPNNGMPAEEFVAFRQELNDFIRDELIPFETSKGLTPETLLSRDVLQQAWKMSRARGIYGANLPASLGGRGLSISQLCQLKEDCTRSNATLYGCVLGENGGPMRLGYVFDHATSEQLEEFFLPVARGERAGCFAQTELQAGSDVSRIQTVAVRDGDDWIITGRKRFITASRTADFALVVAVTDPDKGTDGVTCFLVDASSPGYSVEGQYLPMSGQHIDNDIVFDNVRVPGRNVLGEVGGGFRLGMERINVNRLLHCPTMLGHAVFTYEQAVDYAHRREQFGGAIIQFQSIQHKLADMLTTILASRALIQDVAARADQGRDIRREAAACKLFVSESAFRVADESVQIHGSVGVTKNHPVEWVFRRLRMFRILTGSSEIQRNTIARSITKDWKSSLLPA